MVKNENKKDSERIKWNWTYDTGI